MVYALMVLCFSLGIMGIFRKAAEIHDRSDDNAERVLGFLSLFSIVCLIVLSGFSIMYLIS